MSTSEQAASEQPEKSKIDVPVVQSGSMAGPAYVQGILKDGSKKTFPINQAPGGRGKRAWLYNYCTIVLDETGAIPKNSCTIQCKLCLEKSAKVDTFKVEKASLSTFEAHMKTHNIVASYGRLATSKSLRSYLKDVTPATLWSPKDPEYGLCLRALVEACYVGGRPPHMFNDRGIKKLLRTYSKGKMPAIKPRRIREHADDLIAEKLSQISQEVKASTAQGIQPCITSDIWTAKGFRSSFISFTLHMVDAKFKVKNYSLGALPFNESHTGENIIQMLRSIWSDTLQQQSPFEPTLVTDAAANMRLAGRMHSNVFHIRCILHTFHNAVLKGLDAISEDTDVFDKIQAVCAHFNRSYKRAQTLLNVQNALLKKKNVSQDLLHVDSDEDADNDRDVDVDASNVAVPQRGRGGRRYSTRNRGRGRRGSMNIRTLLSGGGGVSALQTAEQQETVSGVTERLQRDREMRGTFLSKGRPLQIIKEVPTRWNSKYQCMQRLLQLKPALTEYCKLLQSGTQEQRRESSQISISEIQWQDMEQLMEPLSAFKEASVELEVQKQIVSHLVLVILKKLLLKDERTNVYERSSLKQKFCDTAIKYFIDAYDSEPFWMEFSVASYLDPRQRNLMQMEPFWSDPRISRGVLCLKVYTFSDWVSRVKDTVKEYMLLLAKQDFEELKRVKANLTTNADPSNRKRANSSNAVPEPPKRARPEEVPEVQFDVEATAVIPPSQQSHSNSATQPPFATDDTAGPQGDSAPPVPQQRVRKPKMGDLDEVVMTEPTTVSEYETFTKLDFEQYSNCPLASYPAIDPDGEFNLQQWWQHARQSMPLVARVARWSFGIKPASAASEMTFSKAEFVNSKRRMAMSDINLWKASMLKEPQQDTSASSNTSDGYDTDE